MDKDEFLAWKESPATRWVLSRLKAIAQEEAQRLQDQLYNLSLQPPVDWAAQQPQASYLRGRCDRTIEVVSLNFEDVAEEP